MSSPDVSRVLASQAGVDENFSGGFTHPDGIFQKRDQIEMMNGVEGQHTIHRVIVEGNLITVRPEGLEL